MYVDKIFNALTKFFIGKKI